MQRECTADRKLADNGESSPEGLRDTGGERQPESRSVNLHGIDARATVKGFKDVRNLRAVHTNAFVGYRNADFLTGSVLGVSQEGAQTEPASWGAVFYGVADQVLQTLGKGGQVTHHLRQARFDVALNRESGSLRQCVRAGLERV